MRDRSSLIIKRSFIDSSLYLNPVIEDGLLRVLGRLMPSDMSLEWKQSIILPRDASLTRLIVRSEHEKLQHAGVTAIMASLRVRFWIMRLRAIAKRAVRVCVWSAERVHQGHSLKTQPFPSERVSFSPAFSLSFFYMSELTSCRPIVHWRQARTKESLIFTLDLHSDKSSPSEINIVLVYIRFPGSLR